jgi:hypothetical protein
LVSEDSILSSEKWLAAKTAALNSLLSWKVQVPLWAALVLVSLWAGIGAVKIYNDRRKLIARIAIVLNVVTSFTFFSAFTVQGREPEWVAQRTDRGMLARSIDEIREDCKQLVAQAWLDREIHTHPEQESERLGWVFRDILNLPADEVTVEFNAEWFARLAPELPPQLVSLTDANRKSSPLEGLLTEAQAWTEYRASVAFVLLSLMPALPVPSEQMIMFFAIGNRTHRMPGINLHLTFC